MKWIYALLAAACLMPSLVFAQSPEQSKAMRALMNSYNEKQYEQIFNQFTYLMQQALPLDRTLTFFEGIQTEFNQLDSFRYNRFSEVGAVVFDVNFGQRKLEFHLIVEQGDKISYLLVKAPEAEVDPLTNKTKLPASIAQIILENLVNSPENSQAAIAILEGKKTTFYGVKIQDRALVEVDNSQSKFEIGSLTKLFTAHLLAQAVAEKKVDLNQEINSLYPLKFNQEIRLKWLDLANHSSGLPSLPTNLNLSKNPTNPYKNYDSAALESYLRQHLKLRSGTKAFTYSNLGYGILGQSLAKLYNKPYAELMQQNVLKKYGLKNTLVAVDLSDPKLVKGQDPQGQECPNWEFDAMAAAGSMISNVEDLSLFARKHFNTNDPSFTLPMQSTFSSSGNFDIGLGWLITYPLGLDRPILFHNGATSGYSSSMQIDRIGQKAVIVLTNISGFSGDQEIIDRMTNELLLQLK